MLATAWLHANEEIPEAAAPADVGGFVAHLPAFHKVVANAGGLYIEIDTAADRNYDTTGLIRMHRAGIDALVGPSSVSAAKDEPLSVGAAWRLEQPQARMEVEESRPERVRFTVTYRGSGELQKLVESYDLTPERVRVAVEAEGTLGPLALRFPALVFDGARASRVIVEGSRARVELGGSRQTFEIVEPAGVRLTRSGRAVRSRNGYLEAIEARVDGRRAVYTLALETVR